ncbi:MAG: DUF1330 domain-containing protein [Gammaproteobacteria bacterium]|nr:DUF1330 domain-containing protein [Gammaproteobacteria bacterium]
MAKGYVIFTESIRDQGRYDGYVQNAMKTIRQSGGRVIAVDDAPAVLEGQWHGSRTVVLEFDSVQAARDWYNSPEYQAVIGERQASAEANAVMLNGL